jgi:toluene monooxygenase system protein D
MAPSGWTSDDVGPVLTPGALTSAVLATLRELNPEVTVVDRGAYLRVLVPRRCRLSREGVERRLGGPFRLPADLEAIMPSFRGRFRASEDEAVWESEGAP